MKKLLLILAVVVSSCSTDEEQRTETTNCNCETILTADTFTLPNQTTQTVATVENDCTGAQRQRNLVGVYSVGQKICD